MIGIDGWDIVSIDESTRVKVLAAFGLDRFLFAYQERVGSQILRSWMLEGATSEAFFPATEGDAAQADDLPLLIRTHLPKELAEQPLFGVQGLWEELIPFPFRLWGAMNTAEASGGLESADTTWLQAGLDLRQIFQMLHDRISAAEITLLTLVPVEGEPLTLFFHSVRRRFLSLGRLASPEPMSDSADLAKLAASFQRLTIAIPSLANALEDQVAGIREAVAVAVDGKSPTSPALEQSADTGPVPYPL
jgi:hypothetical protein